MTRKDLANSPTEAGPPEIDPGTLERLVAALEGLAAQANADPELQFFKPAEAALLLGVSENWVNDAIRERRIPFTYVGRFPRLTAAHLRAIAAAGEVKPNQFAKKKTPAA